MPLKAEEIYRVLSEWPTRAACSEEEMMARESMVTLLLGEPGVEVNEEGLRVPQTAIPFLWMIAAFQSSALAFANWAPLITVFSGMVGFVSYFFYIDARVSPLIWWTRKKVTANIIASKHSSNDKPDKSKLILLVANIDTPAFSWLGKVVPHRFKVAALYGSLSIVALGVIAPLFAAIGLEVPFFLQGMVICLLLGSALVVQVIYWLHGFKAFTPPNTAGVAAAVRTASRLWRTMPQAAEVRLLLTTGGRLGSQAYWKTHRAELKQRDTTIISFDNLAYNKLGFVGLCGAFLPFSYDAVLLEQAEQLASTTPEFAALGRYPQFIPSAEACWFARDGIPSFCLTTREPERPLAAETTVDLKPNITVPTILLSAAFAEALIRRNAKS